MIINLSLYTVLLVSILGTHGDAKTTGIALRNGLSNCGEDLHHIICDSFATSGGCEKNSEDRQRCSFSCSISGKLWKSAWKGNHTEVKSAIASGANPLCQNTITLKDIPFRNKTAIHIAALGNHPKVVKVLLDAGVDVNLRTPQGVTPTYDAAYNGSVDALKILIDHHANINIPNSNGYTPLKAAAVLGHRNISALLLL